jgi:phosphohistidine phosphatase
MSRELLLLRHGKSDRDLAVDDFDRPLKKRGKFSVQRVAAWLVSEQLVPDFIFSSPAKRALATAKIIHKIIAIESLVIIQDKRLYQEGYERLKLVLATCPVESKRVLLVGHNPELEDLLVYLVGGFNLPDTDKLLPTATLVRLMMPDDWSHLDSGCATLVSLTLAKSLPVANMD